MQVSVLEDRIRQVGAIERDAATARPAKVSGQGAHVRAVRAAEIRAVELGLAEVRAGKIGIVELGAGEVSAIGDRRMSRNLAAVKMVAANIAEVGAIELRAG